MAAVVDDTAHRCRAHLVALHRVVLAVVAILPHAAVRPLRGELAMSPSQDHDRGLEVLWKDGEGIRRLSEA
jgi:hypothetical protein